MKLLNNFKQGLIQGAGFITILALAGITYAYVDFNQTINEVSSNTPISASEYNKLVKKLNAIDEKQLPTAWVNFDATNCSINGNECDIKDEFNVLKVTINATGDYTIHFKEQMSNNLYTVVSGAYAGDEGTETARHIGIKSPRTTNATTSTVRLWSIGLNPTTSLAYNYNDNNIVIFGGK